MPVNQLLLFVVDMVIIFGNLYLYKFLQLDTERREKGLLKILFGYLSNCESQARVRQGLARDGPQGERP